MRHMHGALLCAALRAERNLVHRQVEKHRLVHELNVSYRDLRILDPLV